MVRLLLAIALAVMLVGPSAASAQFTSLECEWDDGQTELTPPAEPVIDLPEPREGEFTFGARAACFGMAQGTVIQPNPINGKNATITASGRYLGISCFAGVPVPSLEPWYAVGIELDDAPWAYVGRAAGAYIGGNGAFVFEPVLGGHAGGGYAHATPDQDTPEPGACVLSSEADFDSVGALSVKSVPQ